MTYKNKFQPERIDELFQIIQTRFEKNMHRHKGLKWPEIQARLEVQTDKL
jgi:RNase P subunit RPR2